MLHAQDRAWQRYNRELDTYAINQIKNSIRNKEYIFIENAKDDERKHFVYVKFNNIPYKVLYIGEKNPRLITIYPFDVDEYNRLAEERKIEKYIKYLIGKGYIIKNGRTGEISRYSKPNSGNN